MIAQMVVVVAGEQREDEATPQFTEVAGNIVPELTDAIRQHGVGTGLALGQTQQAGRRDVRDADFSCAIKSGDDGDALAKAQDEKIKESVEFRAKQLHLKAEIGQIDILATRESEVLAAVTGQIIRSGIFQDKAFTEAFPFTLRLRLIRNPNMALNGRFPTAVGDFKYEITK
jgi:hypothetical protein